VARRQKHTLPPLSTHTTSPVASTLGPRSTNSTGRLDPARVVADDVANHESICLALVCGLCTSGCLAVGAKNAVLYPSINTAEEGRPFHSSSCSHCLHASFLFFFEEILSWLCLNPESSLEARLGPPESPMLSLQQHRA